MENKNELLYYAPQGQPAEPAPLPEKEKVSVRQPVKSMIFGLVALFLSDIPVWNLFLTPVFAIISLCMGGKFRKKHPDVGRGFLKAGKITSIVSLVMSVVVTIVFILAIGLISLGEANNYYYY